MLATPWPDAFDDASWWFEVKWDGYRGIAANTDGAVALRSRRGLDLADRFREVAALDLPLGWVFDGEIVAFDDRGRPDFGLLQSGHPTTYVVFDVLAIPSGPVVGRPWEERRALLEQAALPAAVVRAEPIREQGKALFEAVKAQGLEGIVAKRSGSIYQPGKRSPDWRKVANRLRMRAVVGGWLPGAGARASTFGSLLVGLAVDDGLRFVGAVGSGFSDEQLGPIAAALEELSRSEAPFKDVGAMPRDARWVEPALVISIEFKEWTRDNHLRAPVFKGMEMGPWLDVTWEAEGPA